MASPLRRLGGSRLAATASLLVIVPLALLAAGCGGSASSSGTTAGTTTTTTAAGASGARGGFGGAALTAFTSCLKQHGIATTGFGAGFGRPRGGSGPFGASGARPRFRGGSGPLGGSGARGGGFFGRNVTAAQRKAFTACRSKLPAGADRFRAGGASGFGAGTRNPAFAKYTQCLSKHGVKFGTSSSAATFQKASAACAKLRPPVGGAPPKTAPSG